MTYADWLRGYLTEHEPQEIFDLVAKHLLSQNTQATASEIGSLPRCRLRGYNGTKCAIGCLIPDNLYQPDWEEQVCATKAPNYLVRLRTIHDHSRPVDWPADLIRLAQETGLDDRVVRNWLGGNL